MGSGIRQGRRRLVVREGLRVVVEAFRRSGILRLLATSDVGDGESYFGDHERSNRSNDAHRNQHEAQPGCPESTAIAIGLVLDEVIVQEALRDALRLRLRHGGYLARAQAVLEPGRGGLLAA